MTTLILTTTIMALIMFAMAVGVIFSDRCLQGSCGGAESEDCACDTAGKLN